MHWVVAPDGVPVPVDVSPESLFAGVRDHFGGSAEAFVRAYFRAVRESVSAFDFDMAAHPDLVRKFNAKHPWFDESAPWYLEEIERTADALARSGKYVEVNTGGLYKGMGKTNPEDRILRRYLELGGRRLTFGSDAHRPEQVGYGFETLPDYG